MHRPRSPRRPALAALAALALLLVPAAALAAGATPLTTGQSPDGQQGSGSTTGRTSPGPVLVANAVSIASGRDHAYALDDQGRIWAWGDNAFGAVGDGTTVDRPTPVRLALTNVIEIEAGHYHGIALRSDGTVWTWGQGSLGQLGLGTTTNRPAPVQVPGIASAVHLAAGRDMSYVILADGTVRAFGSNAAGEVGDGTTTRRLSPVPVLGLTGVVELSGGRNHAIAVRSDGSAWTWGANDYGQIGDGTMTTRLLPVRVIASGVRHVDAGAEHTVALLDDGTVRTWGRGWRGQLGLGTTTNRLVPTAVGGLPTIVEVGDGRDQTYALTATGAVWAWGHNDLGQIGDGTTTTRNAPVLLPGLSGIGMAQGGRGHAVLLPVAPATPDTEPPTAPGQPAGTSTTPGSADLTWQAATDDRATTLTYRVFRDGGATPIATLSGPATGTIAFSDTGLEPGSIHTWTVDASDGTNQGPLSAASDPVTIATGPPPPTVLAQTGFEAGLTGWTGVRGLTVDAATGSPLDAPPSILASVTAAAGTAQLALSATAPAVCARIDLRLESFTGSRYAALKLRTAAGASVARIWVEPTGRLLVRADRTGTTLTTTATIGVNQWHRVQLCARTGAGGSLRLDLDGATVGSWAADAGLDPLARVQLGDDAAQTARVRFDALLATAWT